MEEHSSFRALMLEQAGEGVRAEFREVPASALPEGDVLVRVAYSSLNYKDGLAVTGKGRIVQQYPMVPGIDLTGTVMESRAAGWKPGDEVVLTGWGIGERHWGGYAGLARVKGEWLVPLPSGLILRDAMVLGTAGFTAMLCVLALEGHGLSPEWAGDREVVVTGASGGVGSVAVAVLGRLGYNVTAVSGRAEAGEYLRALGARQVVGRDALPTGSSRPLESQRWAGAVDVVGGEVLAALLRQMAYNSGIAICGLAGGSNLTTSVFPFILRGVGLLGVESVLCPPERRRIAWERLARDLPKDALARIGHVHPLADVPALAEQILRGQVRGRAVTIVPIWTTSKSCPWTCRGWMSFDERASYHDRKCVARANQSPVGPGQEFALRPVPADAGSAGFLAPRKEGAGAGSPSPRPRRDPSSALREGLAFDHV